MVEIVLTPLEREAMSMLLAGDDPDLHALSAQFNIATAIRREMTGVGFYVDFHVPDCHRLGDRNFEIGDVSAEIDGLEYGASFIVFVRHGILSQLEGCSCVGSWPTDVQQFKFSYDQYVGKEASGRISVVDPSPKRDLEMLKRSIR